MLDQRTAPDNRLRQVWAIIFWEGSIRNARLQDIFGLKTVQTSRLLALFCETYPNLLSYDHRTKIYTLNRKLLRKLKAPTKPDVEEYLQVVSAAPGSKIPWLIDARINYMVHPQAEVLAQIRKAILNGARVEVDYASMGTPHGGPRVIAPHAVVRLATRWHVRAWCEKRQDYRDFNLGRIKKPRLIVKPKPGGSVQTLDRPVDTLWETMIKFRIRAHRDLTRDQQSVIREEYFGGTMGRVVTVRAPLLSYTVQEMRAAVNPLVEKPPEFQLEVSDVAKLRKYLFPSGGS